MSIQGAALEPPELGSVALAEQEALLCCQALAMDFILLQLLVVWMPEFHDNSLNV